MDVVSRGTGPDIAAPCSPASLVWQPRAGVWALTVVCKATFRLRPTQSPLAEEQDPPNEEDNHWNDDPSRSLYSPSDLVPFKPRSDVVLVGSAFAPRKEAVRSLVVRLVVGTIDKSIEVFGDRFFLQDGELRDCAQIAKMPIRYERAAGGPDTWNPVGVRLDGLPDAHGYVQLPNLQPPGLHIVRRHEPIPPIGLGPIAAEWPTRLDYVAACTEEWSHTRWMDQPIPEGADFGYFNVAPPDQQVESPLRSDERIVLENLHPDYPSLTTSLPGLRARAMIERAGAAPEELTMRADTLWIDTDRSICALTWRGQMKLEHPEEAGRVVVSLERDITPAPAPRSATVTTELSPDDLHELREVPLAPAPPPSALGDRVPAGALGDAPPPVAAAPPRPSAPPPRVRAPAPQAPPVAAREVAAPAVAAKDPKGTPTEILKLVWFDPRLMARVRKHPQWEALVAEVEPQLVGKDDESGGELPSAKDQRAIFAVLSRGRAIGVDGLKLALVDAIGKDGRLSPPLALVAGDLEFPFDELATLKATVTAVSPLVSGDPRLAETLEAVERFLRTPWFPRSGGVAAGLTQRVKDAFSTAAKALPPDYLASATERMLLEQRCYQRRTVFGKTWIRGVMRGGTGDVPLYVPDALGDALPMFRKVKVRVIGEVDAREDQYEACLRAVKVMALARVVEGV